MRSGSIGERATAGNGAPAPLRRRGDAVYDAPPRRLAAPAGRCAMSRRVLLPFVAALTGAAACTVQPSDPAGITLAIDSGPASLDPRVGSDDASRRFQDLVFNSLVRTGDDATPVPDLARDI
jgi:hypothetical protein